MPEKRDLLEMADAALESVTGEIIYDFPDWAQATVGIAQALSLLDIAKSLRVLATTRRVIWRCKGCGHEWEGTWRLNYSPACPVCISDEIGIAREA